MDMEDLLKKVEHQNSELPYKNVLKIAAATKKEILQLLYDDSVKWDLCRTSKSISTFRCTSDDMARRGHVFKTEAILKTDLETIVCLLDPAAPYRVNWDSNLIETRVVNQLSPNFLVIHHTLGAQLKGLISARDFVYFCYSENTAKGTNIFFSSVTWPNCSETIGTVRANFYPCVFSMERTKDPNVTVVKSILQVEMNLPWVIPVYLVDATIPREIQTFYQKLKEASKTLIVDKAVHRRD